MSVDIERIKKNVEMAGWTDPADIFELIEEVRRSHTEAAELRKGVESLGGALWELVQEAEDAPEEFRSITDKALLRARAALSQTKLENVEEK